MKILFFFEKCKDAAFNSHLLYSANWLSSSGLCDNVIGYSLSEKSDTGDVSD